MSQWLRSNKACVLFSYSSWAVLCTGLFMIFMLTPWFRQIEARPTADLILRILAAPLALVVAPAFVIIWFGMAAFCVRGDRSPVSAKIAWFILFFAAGPFGSAAYFFRVYRRQAGSQSQPCSGRDLSLLQWLQTNQACRLFSYSVWVIPCWGFVTIVSFTPWYKQIGARPTFGFLLAALITPLICVSLLAIPVIWFGMAAFCVRWDRSRVSVKILWFILFLVTGPFGSAAYFFMVYRKQVQGESPRTSR